MKSEMKVLDCIIIDDEPHAVEVIRRYVEQISHLRLKGTFRNPLKALEFLKDNSIDLLFLDISMPHLTGIQLLNTLSRKPMIIFTTAFSDHAATSYELDAIDYLVKPIEFDRFLKAVTKASDFYTMRTSSDAKSVTREEKILLKSGAVTHQVRLDEICYIAKSSNYLEVFLSDRKILLRANMNDVFTWLPSESFCRIHKSYVVAISKIENFESHQVQIGKIRLPISASYRTEFMKRMGLPG